MDLSRRQFTVLGLAAASSCVPPSETRADAATAGAARTVGPDEVGGRAARVFDAGLLSEYAAHGVYDAFRGDGFFLVRREREIIAISSVCTHKGCKVRPQADRSFLCKCHGSRFDPNGKVINPPARRDLPRLKVALGANKHVLVRLPETRQRG